jgi:hypothetical protein
MYQTKYIKYKKKYMLLKNQMGGTNSDFINFCYYIIDNNIDIFDLSIHTENKSINLSNLYNYISSNQSCSVKYLNFIKVIFENIKYISNDEAIRILDDNIDEIINTFSEYNHILFISNDFDNIKKSNFYFTLYFLKRYRDISGKIIDDIVYSDYLTPIFNDKKNLIILCDDVSYSGQQIVETLISKNLNNYLDNIKKKYSSFMISIYLNIFGYTDIANNYICEYMPFTYSGLTVNSIKILFPQNQQPIVNKISKVLQKISGSVNIFLISENIFNNDILIYKKNNILSSLFFLFEYYDYNLVYLFLKYPDKFSIYPSFCAIELLDSKTETFNKEFMDTVNFIELCSSIKQLCSENKLLNVNKFKNGFMGITGTNILNNLKEISPNTLQKNGWNKYFLFYFLLPIISLASLSELFKITRIVNCIDIKHEFDDVIINKKTNQTWIKMINNCNINENFNGDCESKGDIEKDCIYPFYKKIQWKINDTVIVGYESLKEIYKNMHLIKSEKKKIEGNDYGENDYGMSGVLCTIM